MIMNYPKYKEYEYEATNTISIFIRTKNKKMLERESLEKISMILLLFITNTNFLHREVTSYPPPPLPSITSDSTCPLSKSLGSALILITPQPSLQNHKTKPPKPLLKSFQICAKYPHPNCHNLVPRATILQL